VSLLPAYFNCIAFVVIAGFHFYWVAGGKFGTDAVFPKLKGRPDVFPSKAMTLAAALIFLGFAFLFFNAIFGYYPYSSQHLVLALAVIFLIRAIGEFKYIGFTKRIYNSKFATLDTKLYSPLCLILALNAFYLYVFK
jgi:hypothetical protein